MHPMTSVVVGPAPLSFSDVFAVARGGAPVELAPEALELIA
jgi:hypothetical protein